MVEDTEPDFRKHSGGKRLAFPPFGGAALGGLVGLVNGAADSSGGMLSGLVPFIHAALGSVLGGLFGLFIGVVLYLARER